MGKGISNKKDNKDIENLMTGKLLDVLKNSLEFENKEDFIRACSDLSKIRNRLAHKLTLKSKLDKIKLSASKYREKYRELEELFDEINDNFRLFYKDIRKDDKWDWQLDDYIRTLDAKKDKEAIAECKRLRKLRKDARFEPPSL